jgi:hypothetical protein
MKNILNKIWQGIKWTTTIVLKGLLYIGWYLLALITLPITLPLMPLAFLIFFGTFENNIKKILKK